VIGINSFVISYCAQSVLTRVSAFVPWIKQMIYRFS